MIGEFESRSQNVAHRRNNYLMQVREDGQAMAEEAMCEAARTSRAGFGIRSKTYSRSSLGCKT
jgi:hypothetical protein